MWIVADAGNSEIAVGLYDGAVRATFRMATPAAITADELAWRLAALAARAFPRDAQPRGVLVASVVPPLDAALRAGLAAAFGIPVHFLGDPGIAPRIPIAYRHPEELGADRLANAVAAKARLGAPVIVADLGTATTLDVVDAKGAYAGGLILPGPSMQMRALAEGTARLGAVRLAPPPSVIGTTTEESLQAGVLWGTATAITGLVARIREEIGAPAPLVLTGGQAHLVQGLLPETAPVIPELTLEGLGRIAEEALA